MHIIYHVVVAGVTCGFQVLAKVAGLPACVKDIAKVRNRRVAKSLFVHLLILLLLIILLVTNFIPR